MRWVGVISRTNHLWRIDNHSEEMNRVISEKKMS